MQMPQVMVPRVRQDHRENTGRRYSFERLEGCYLRGGVLQDRSLLLDTKANIMHVNATVKENRHVLVWTMILVLICLPGCTISPQQRSLTASERQTFARQLEGELWRIEDADSKATLFLTKIEDDIDCHIAEINSFVNGINSGMIGTTGVEVREKPENIKVTILF